MSHLVEDPGGSLCCDVFSHVEGIVLVSKLQWEERQLCEEILIVNLLGFGITQETDASAYL